MRWTFCTVGTFLTIQSLVFAADHASTPLHGNQPRPMATLATGQTKTTKSGHVFTRDRSNPKLGEAWRDPSGMIWGDIVKKEDGSPRFMNHKDAVEYCKSIGAELPTKEDFTRLREYMGARSNGYRGYSPQVLPNLTYTKDGRSYRLYFWSASIPSVLPYFSNDAYAFDGRNGAFDFFYRHFAYYIVSVRCVVSRR